MSLREAISQLFYDLFLGAISRFPLYLLFRCATQKDVAAIGAKKIGTFITTPSKILLKFHHPFRGGGFSRYKL
ncbi:hypothetical protein J3D55_004109 [Chryseobacterium ginsenosidimutans]|nr:hypothetical protein [Chryseobacterium ginsenosidimutans]